jgi:hypothetical protein
MFRCEYKTFVAYYWLNTSGILTVCLVQRVRFYTKNLVKLRRIYCTKGGNVKDL